MECVEEVPHHPKHTVSHHWRYRLGPRIQEDHRWQQQRLAYVLVGAEERNQRGLVDTCIVHICRPTPSDVCATEISL